MGIFYSYCSLFYGFQMNINKKFFGTQGLFIWGELAQLGGLAHLSEMIFSHIHMGSSISVQSKSVMSLEKDCFHRILQSYIFCY